jgi:hypothetical protein
MTPHNPSTSPFDVARAAAAGASTVMLTNRCGRPSSETPAAGSRDEHLTRHEAIEAGTTAGPRIGRVLAGVVGSI